MDNNLEKRNKLIFNLYINNQLDTSSIIEEYKLTPHTIKLIIKKYAYNSANHEERIKYNQAKVLEKTNLSILELETIYKLFVKHNWNIDFNTKELEPYNITVEQLEIYAKLYDIFFVKASGDIIYEDLKLKYREDEELKKAKTIIELFIQERIINHNLTKSFFCEQRKISKAFLQKCINLVMEKDKSLYNKYEQSLKISKEIYANKEEKNILNLLYYLYNGKEDQGIIRKYDVIDFQMDFNNDASNVAQAALELYRQKKITITDLQTIRKFINKMGYKQTGIKSNENSYQNFNDTEIQDILNSYKEFNCQKDKKGYPIKGTGRVITYEENEEVLNFLKSNNLNQNIITYNAGIQRILLGINLVSHTKSLTKK